MKVELAPVPDRARARIATRVLAAALIGAGAGLAACSDDGKVTHAQSRPAADESDPVPETWDEFVALMDRRLATLDQKLDDLGEGVRRAGAKAAPEARETWEQGAVVRRELASRYEQLKASAAHASREHWRDVEQSYEGLRRRVDAALEKLR